MLNKPSRRIGKQCLQRCFVLVCICATLLNTLWMPKASASTEGTLSAKVVLRKSTDSDSKALQTLPEGDTVDILSTSGDWYKINYGEYTGYVLKKYVTVDKKSVVANTEKIAALGDAPGALHVGDEGNDVKKLSEKSE